MKNTQPRQSVAHARTPAQSPWTGLVRADPSDRTAISQSQRGYSQSFQRLEAQRPRLFVRLARSFRTAKTGNRVLKPAANGVTLDRIQKVLERENCTVEKVKFSDTNDTVFIDFVFQDGGSCLAILTDKLSNNTYVRCCFTALFDDAFDPERINELNMHSKFLKFYKLKNDRLCTEYSVLLIDLNDNAFAANVDMFHGAVQYIFSNNFLYDGMS